MNKLRFGNLFATSCWSWNCLEIGEKLGNVWETELKNQIKLFAASWSQTYFELEVLHLDIQLILSGS